MGFFGFVAFCVEAHPDNNPGAVYDNLRGLQGWMHDWAKGLTTFLGRGLFYIFQGCVTIASSKMLSLGLVVGVYMIVAGTSCLALHVKHHAHRREEPSMDYIAVGA